VPTLALLALLTSPVAGEEWATWRGPDKTGVSHETGLVASWSVEGENLIWRDPDFVGRSTPVVLDGRVCANGRVGEDRMQQALVACWSAESGERLWERRFVIYNTTVPFSRVGWAALEGDPETGYVYAQFVDGRLTCLDAEGNTVWEQRLAEDFGRASGYGGRTQSPVVDEDRLIVSLLGSSWGEQAAPRHRFYAFDKRTGVVLWTQLPANNPWDDANTQGTPVVAEIAGRRLLIGGGADGGVYALDARTGANVWSFELSKRGINVTPAVVGDTVYITHSEENLDTGEMGRIVAIDATGQGNVTTTHERWRNDDVMSGFPSPAVHDGRLYVADNSANLHAVDLATGKVLWEHNFGTVGKASPVWADGKIYVPQVNGDVVIIEPGVDSARTLDTTHVEVEGGRYAEIYGSPAIAYGRIYVSTEAGIFCIGDPARAFEATPSHAPAPQPADPNAAPAAIRVVPNEAVGQAGDAIRYEARALDAQGRTLRRVDVAWSLDGLQGEIGADGVLQVPADAPGQVGKVVARLGDLEATGRLRLGGALPLSEDFSSGAIPKHWLGGGRFQVSERDGDRRLHKAPAERGFQRGTIFMGPELLTGYVIQADILGLKKGRRQPDIGIINGGYAMELLGPHQQVRIQSWAAERRMAGFADFQWAPETWYTMKLRVDQEGGEAVIRGRVWKTGEPEPDAWSIEVRDPLAIGRGSPGLTCDSGVDVFYDNVKVMEKE
jgi:outer membrane protein assembly factor BamB